MTIVVAVELHSCKAVGVQELVTLTKSLLLIHRIKKLLSITLCQKKCHFNMPYMHLLNNERVNFFSEIHKS